MRVYNILQNFTRKGDEEEMFNRKTKELQSLLEARTEALKRAERKIEKQEETIKDLRYEIQEEHLENYRHHRKLLAVDKAIKEQNFNSIDNLKNKIRTILDKKELDRLGKHI